jgi:hypothetical protein
MNKTNKFLNPVLENQSSKLGKIANIDSITP